MLHLRVCVQHEPEDRREHEQQREDREERVVRDQRGQVAGLVVGELPDHGHGDRPAGVRLLEAVEPPNRAEQVHDQLVPEGWGENLSRIVTPVAAVRANGLVKRFETTTAVDGVNLSVDEGEVRGLLGPNGAGKTSLLRLLFGLVTPDQGEVELFGHPLGTAESVNLDGVGGFVEEPTFYPYLSGRVNLELFAELDGGVAGYSTGRRQRLGIAAALLRSPRLLLLDEPTSGLDPAGARDMARLVRQLASEGTAVLLSSHLIGDLEHVCDSFTVLRLGKVVWDGSAQQLREQAPGSAYRLLTSDD